MPGAAGSSQERPGTARSSQERPAARSGQEQSPHTAIHVVSRDFSNRFPKDYMGRARLDSTDGTDGWTDGDQS